MFFPTYIRAINSIRNVKVISNIHDLQFKHYPNYFSRTQRLVFNLFYPISLKKSDRLIAISNYVKDDILNYFGHIPSDKITTIYNPIDFESLDLIATNENVDILTKYNLDKGNYILSVASLLPHKNIPTLIKAFSNLITEYPGLKLVLVGVKGKSLDKIEKLIKELKIIKNVIIPGFVNDEELSALYSNAKVFVSSSVFEGFGMPPVEAMYKKIPTITTNCASLPEVTLHKATYYKNPYDDKELSNAIREVIMNPPSELELQEISDLIKDRYSFERIAKMYINLFESVYDIDR